MPIIRHPKDFRDKYKKLINISILVFICTAILVIGLTCIFFGYSKDFIRDVFVEAHGMLFDILIIGIVIFSLHLYFERKHQKEREIRRHREIIDDFRPWKTEESKLRVVGSILRLNDLGISDINLSYCYLEGAELGSDIEKLDEIARALETDDHLKEMKTKGYTRIEVGREVIVKLAGSFLYKTNFRKANLKEVDFSEAIFSDTILDDADLWRANLKSAKNLTVEQLSKVKTLYEAELEEGIKQELIENYPHLFEVPEWLKQGKHYIPKDN